MADRAERFAAAVLRQRDVSREDLESWLTLVEFPTSGRAVNAARTRGFCLGAVRSGPFNSLTALSRWNPFGVRLLVNFGSKHVHRPWTAVQINRGLNYSGRDECFQEAHVDGNSHSQYLQPATAFGNFSGGDLAVADLPGVWAADATHAVTSMWLPVPRRVGPYARGDEVYCHVYNLRGSWVRYHPRALHCPLPYQGVRFSVVYFTADLKYGQRPTDFTDQDIAEYLSLGLPVSGLEACGIGGLRGCAVSRGVFGSQARGSQLATLAELESAAHARAREILASHEAWPDL